MLAEIVYDGQLSGTAYAIIAVMILLLGGGFSWCFYRAIRAVKNDEEQVAGEE